MILGIGIDTVEIERFAYWHTYDHKKLLRLFSQSEIDYCLSVPTKSAERFAVRFAAREATYKAYSQAFPGHSIPFLTFCKAMTVHKDAYHLPRIIFATHYFAAGKIPRALLNTIVLTSFTHSKTAASAVVIFQQKDCH